MNYRDWLQQVIYKIINPIVRGMIKIGITPNFITTTGLILNIVATGIFIYAGLVTDSEEDLSLVGWTGGLILFAGLFDMMDGRVARLGNMSSTSGHCTILCSIVTVNCLPCSVYPIISSCRAISWVPLSLFLL